MQRLPTPAPSFLETIYRIPEGIIYNYLQNKDEDSLALLKLLYVEVTKHETSFSGFLDVINLLPLDCIESLYSKTLTDTAKVDLFRRTIASIQSFIGSVEAPVLEAQQTQVALPPAPAPLFDPRKIMPILPANFVSVIPGTGILFDKVRHKGYFGEKIHADKLAERQQRSQMVEVVAGTSTFYNKKRHNQLKTELINYRELSSRRSFKENYEVLKGTLVEYEDKFGDKETEFVSRDVMNAKKVESAAKKAKRHRESSQQEPNLFRQKPRCNVQDSAVVTSNKKSSS